MKKVISLTLAFAIIIISSVVALADSDDEARVFPMPLSDDFVYESLQSGDALRAVEYTTTDIYNLLYSALRGENYMSIYSLPMIASYTDRIAQTLYGSGQSVPTTSLYTLTNNILSSLTYYDDGVPSGIGSLLGEIMYDNIDNKNYLANISAKSSSIDSKLSSLNNINWSTFSSTFQGAKSTYGGDWLSPGTYYDLYFFFSVPAQYNLFPDVLLVNLPVYAQYNLNAGQPPFRLVEIFNDGDMADSSGFDYFLEPTNAGSNLYLFNYTQRGTSMVFHVQSDQLLNYNSTYGGYMKYIPFDTDAYHQIKQSFYAYKSANSLSGLDKLVEVYASPDKIAAEQAQQGVESQVLDDFTGQGTESMSLSDVGGVKNVSSNAKQFLGTGSSGSNALSVFNVNGQGLWQWFSQTTADNLDSTTPTRGSDGYLTIYDQNMQNYLDGLGGDELAR